MRASGWRTKLNTFKCEISISWRQVYSMGLQTCRRQGWTWRYSIHLWSDVRDGLCMEAAQDPVTCLSWESVQVFLQKMVLPVSNFWSAPWLCWSWVEVLCVQAVPKMSDLGPKRHADICKISWTVSRIELDKGFTYLNILWELLLNSWEYSVRMGQI